MTRDAWSEAVEQTLGRDIGEATGLHQRGYAPESVGAGSSGSSRLCLLVLAGLPCVCVCLAFLAYLGGV